MKLEDKEKWQNQIGSAERKLNLILDIQQLICYH
jgi:hypothetical protein